MTFLTPIGHSITMFTVSHTQPVTWHEFFPIAIIGILGGLFGALFNFLNMKVAQLRQSESYKKKVSGYVEVCMIVFITALTQYPTTYARPLSSLTIHALFESCSTPSGSSPVPRDLGICKAERDLEGVGLYFF